MRHASQRNWNRLFGYLINRLPGRGINSLLILILLITGLSASLSGQGVLSQLYWAAFPGVQLVKEGLIRIGVVPPPPPAWSLLLESDQLEGTFVCRIRGVRGKPGNVTLFRIPPEESTADASILVIPYLNQ